MSKGRRTEDFKGPHPDVGKATQIKPGEVRNPTGRPRRLPFTEKYKEILEQILNAKLCRLYGIPKKFIGMKVLDAIAINTVGIAATGEKFAILASKELREPIEGKAVQRIAGPDGEALVPPKLTVNFIPRGKKK